MAGSSDAVAYGGHHFGYGYHHFGHHGHHGHHGFHASIHHHGGIGTAGYVVLGILGAVVLSHIIDSHTYRQRGYYKPYSYRPPESYSKPARVVAMTPSYSEPVYSYGSHDGWKELTKGNAGHALDIFAVQSQQNLNSGIPKVGFALAAAANGELDRGTRAMRKAVRIDPASLDNIIIDVKLEATIDSLSERYRLALQSEERHTDMAFMVAALSYLQQDYATARDSIAKKDRSRSANNLRKLIDNTE